MKWNWRRFVIWAGVTYGLFGVYEETYQINHIAGRYMGYSLMILFGFALKMLKWDK